MGALLRIKYFNKILTKPCIFTWFFCVIFVPTKKIGIMKSSTVLVYITDKNGGQMFKEYCSFDYVESAKRNLQRHLDSAKKNPKFYHFLDSETAEIKIEIIN